MSHARQMTGLIVLCFLAAAACGGNDTPSRTAAATETVPERTFLPEGSRCDTAVPPEVLAAGSADPNCTPRVESVEADLNHDGHLDLRRVYLLGCPTILGEDVKPEILCRESDLNLDGRKDIFRHFREGEAFMEEQDWNFDGTLDARVYFAGGNPVSLDIDRDGDAVFEMQVMLQEGGVRRVKLDVVGDDHFDIYETYESFEANAPPRLNSVGYDLEGDGVMDRLLMLEVPVTEAEGEGTAPAGGEE